MTRMERATAHMALVPPRRRSPGGASRRGTYRSPGAVGGLGAVGRGRRRPVLFRLALAGAGLAGDGASPAQDTRWSAVGNLVMSRPVSAMISLASLRLTPGISASLCAAGSTAASGPGPGGTPPRSTPQAAGMASRAASISSSISATSRSSRWCGPCAGGQPGVVAPKHAVQCLLQLAAPPGPREPRASPDSARGSRSPAMKRLQDRPGGLVPRQRGDDRRQSPPGRLPAVSPAAATGAVRSRTSWRRVRVQSRSARGSPAAARTRGAAGPSRPAGRSTARRAGRSSAGR